MTARNATSLLARQPQGLYAEYARRSLTRSAIRSVENASFQLVACNHTLPVGYWCSVLGFTLWKLTLRTPSEHLMREITPEHGLYRIGDLSGPPGVRRALSKRTSRVISKSVQK
jgi:hypothetical protein